MEVAVGDVVAMVSRLAAAFDENRERLNELDARLGDGDHGLSMARGFSAFASFLEENPPASVGEALVKGGAQFNEVSGSTIGILMFSALREAGRAAAGKDTISLADLTVMLEAAIGGIKKRGKAEVGQKTILDSLHPALEALQAGTASGDPEEAILERARQAAAQGAEGTRGLDSQVGRARWFAGRSKGEIDPGAVSGAIIVDTVVAYLLGR